MGTIVKTSLPDESEVFQVFGLIELAAEDETGTPVDIVRLTLSKQADSTDAPTVSRILVDYCSEEGKLKVGGLGQSRRGR